MGNVPDPWTCVSGTFRLLGREREDEKSFSPYPVTVGKRIVLFSHGHNKREIDPLERQKQCAWGKGTDFSHKHSDRPGLQ